VDVSGVAAITLLGMMAVTYGARVTGVVLMSRIPLSDRLRGWLESIPGAVLVAIIAPMVLTHGPPEILAGLVTAAVAVRSRNMLLSAAVGVLTVWALRHVL